MNPIKAQAILTPQEVSTIFSNITLILTINTELLNDLQKVKKSKPSTQNIGEIFLKLVSALWMDSSPNASSNRASMCYWGGGEI